MNTWTGRRTDEYTDRTDEREAGGQENEQVDGRAANLSHGRLANEGKVRRLGGVGRSVKTFSSIVSTQHSESVTQFFHRLTHLFVCKHRLSSSTERSRLDQCSITAFHRTVY